MNITPTERDCILRTDFLSFAKGAFAVLEPDKTLEECWHHEAIARVLVELEGKKTRRFINGPPRSLKSFLVSVAWVAFKLGRDPTHKLICAKLLKTTCRVISARMPQVNAIKMVLPALSEPAF